jgi:hypothetical protein
VKNEGVLKCARNIAFAGAMAVACVLQPTAASGQATISPEDPTAAVEITDARVEAVIESARTARVGNTEVGQRQSGDFGEDAAVNPYDRVTNRLPNRVQNRIRNRIDRYYRPDANVTAPFVVAGELPEEDDSKPSR